MTNTYIFDAPIAGEHHASTLVVKAESEMAAKMKLHRHAKPQSEQEPGEDEPTPRMVNEMIERTEPHRLKPTEVFRGGA
jgi:hypothetical protein